MILNNIGRINNQETPTQVEQENVLDKMPSFEEHMKTAAEELQDDKELHFEEWKDFPAAMEGVDEREDVENVPQTLWRGERFYLSNIDELGRRSISTAGHESKNNREGEVFCARDEKYASLYAVGTDGVKWYDNELPVEEIPIGVVYKIDNTDNYLGAQPSSDEPEFIGPFAGKFREFTLTNEIPAGKYSVAEIYIMDDFDQPGGHRRSDFRRPKEVIKIKDQKDLPRAIELVKKRMEELDRKRHESS